jgi:hypothetical protein
MACHQCPRLPPWKICQCTFSCRACNSSCPCIPSMRRRAGRGHNPGKQSLHESFRAFLSGHESNGSIHFQSSSFEFLCPPHPPPPPSRNEISPSMRHRPDPPIRGYFVYTFSVLEKRHLWSKFKKLGFPFFGARARDHVAAPSPPPSTCGCNVRGNYDACDASPQCIL